MKKRVHGLELELLALATQANDLSPGKPTLDKFLFKLRKEYGNFTTQAELSGGGSEARAILSNQAQAYIDQIDYFEICTPECTSILDLVRHERISKDIVRRQLKEFNEELRNFPSENKRLHLFSSASDAHRKFTNGCHENYFCYGVGITSKIAEIIATFLIA